MKDKLINHLVSFRYGMRTLYGEVLYVMEKEDGSTYVIQAGKTLYKGIYLKDIIADYGEEL